MNTQAIESLPLTELDQLGFFPAPGEDETAFRTRLRQREQEYQELLAALKGNKKVEIFEGIEISNALAISPDIMAEGKDLTWNLYGFHGNRTPGFFLTSPVGLLWGGCSVTEEGKTIPVIFLRNSFKKQKKWFLYTRSELISHELCHAARTPLDGKILEEFFAYQTSDSALRRYLGNCFISQYDALYFLGPSLLVLLVQILRIFGGMALPILPFWILTAAGFFWLLLRNHLARRKYFRAKHFVEQSGLTPGRAVLFRSTDKEINIFASGEKATRKFLAGANDLRWQIIKQRFSRKD